MGQCTSAERSPQRLAVAAAVALIGVTGHGCSDDDEGAAVDGGVDASLSDGIDSETHTGDGGTTGDPTTLPRLAIDDLTFIGAFRLPADEFGVSSLNYSEGPIAIDSVRRSVFLVGHNHHQAIAEFPLPELANSRTLADLPMAAPPLQPFADVLGRIEGGNPQEINRLAGMRLFSSSGATVLIVNGYEYYDAPADNTHTTLVVRRPQELASSAIDGLYSFDARAHAAGFISPVPSEWQALLGGTHLTGSSSGMPIIGRLSVGPSAFVFDPGPLIAGTSVPDPVPTRTLLDFDLEHPLHADLSNDTGTNDLWTHLSRAVYGFIASGTRTYVTLGHSGGHASGVCYKCTPRGATQECGGYCANDESDYGTYYWLWDVRDLLAVHEGRMESSAPRPYAHGALPLPFEVRELGGGDLDSTDGTLYLTLQAADTEQGEYANPPVVAAFRVRTGG